MSKSDVRLLFFYVIAPWIAILLLRVLFPGASWAPLYLESWLHILGWILTTTVGFVLGISISSTPRGHTRIFEVASPVINRLLIVAFTGAVFLIVEFAFIRNYGFGQNVSLIRSLEVSRFLEGQINTSVLGAIGRLMTPCLLYTSPSPRDS